MLADYYAGSGQMIRLRRSSQTWPRGIPKTLLCRRDTFAFFFQVKDYATARTVVAELMKNSSKDPEVAALNGIVLLNDGKATEAVNALLGGAKNFPKDAFIQYWLGKAALATGDSALAEKSFRQAAALNPTALGAPEALAQIAAQRGDMNLLADVANKTIAAVPHFPGGYVWRATVEMSHNSADKAEADLRLQSAPLRKARRPISNSANFGSHRNVSRWSLLLEQALQYDPNSVESMRLLIGYDLYQKQTGQSVGSLERTNSQESEQ